MYNFQPGCPRWKLSLRRITEAAAEASLERALCGKYAGGILKTKRSSYENNRTKLRSGAFQRK